MKHLKVFIFSLLFALSVNVFSGIIPFPKPQETASKISKPSVKDSNFLKIADSLQEKSAFDSALIFYEKARKHFSREDNWKGYIRCLLEMAEIKRVNQKRGAALDLINQAIRKSEEQDLTRVEIYPEVIRKKGVILLDSGMVNLSLDHFKQAFAIKKRLSGKVDTGFASYFNSFGNVYYYRHERLKALESYQKALELEQKKELPDSSDLAMYYQNVAILYGDRGDYERSKNYFIKALEINEVTLDSNSPGLARNYINIGRLYNLTDNEEQSLKYFDKALNIYKKIFEPDNQYLGRIYLNKGIIYSSRSDYEKALHYFNEALNIFNKSLDKNHPLIQSTFMNIGYVHKEKSEFRKALEYYARSIPDNPQNPSLIRIYRNYAEIYNQTDSLDKAEKYYQKAIQKAEEIYGTDHSQLALGYLNYGRFLLYHNEEERAYSYLIRAKNIYEKLFEGKNRDLANAVSYLGNYHQTNNKYRKAIDFYQEAIINIVDDFNVKDVFVNPSLQNLEADEYLLYALQKKGNAFFNLYQHKSHDLRDLKKSQETLKLTIKLIEKIRNTFLNEDSKIMLSADEEDIYNETILVSLELYKATNNEKYLAEAFTFTEKSKSSVLLSHMREVEARQIGRIPDSLRQKEQNIKANIASYNKLIHEEEQKENPNNDRINLWKSRLFDYNQQYEKLITRFENNFEEYYRLKYKTEVLQVNEIRQMLDTNQALVEYNLADTLLFTFVITPTEYHVERTSIDTTFFNNISEVRQALMVSRMDHFDQQNYNNYVFAAHDLYNKLIKPVKDKIEHKKLLLIPHNELGFISFDVLLQQEADTTRMEYRGLDYLVNDYTLSYASNATLYFHELERDSKATKDILAFAPSYDAKNPIKAKEIMRQTDDIEYLLPIPGVFEEVNFIKKNFKADVFKGKKATEKNFKKRAQKYSVLHLAMHTLINNEEPMFSKLVFYQDDNTRNNDEDPALNTYELFNMELNADMAVLSACNTGVGKLRKGEGIMSLARGFLYARVPSIIMTLWPAQDQSSADLMAQFYKYLAQGYAKDEALRKAKVNFIENADQLRGHPHYWAGYVAIGDTSNINIPDKTPLWSFYAGGGIIVVLMASLLFFLIRRKKMKA